MTEQLGRSRAADEGFTLIELLIAVVMVGVLTAVVIVGIAGLTNNGKSAACSASRDASKAATAVHYANTSGTYPATLTAMTGTTPSELDLPTGGTMAADGLSYTANGWTLTMTAGTPPSFACS